MVISPRAFSAIALATVMVLVVGRARSDEASDPAKAKALFDEARALVKAGDWPAACAKLEESVALDREMNGLYRLAECDEHVGKLASAWRRFLEAADVATKSGQPAKAKAARARAASLESKMPRLTVEVDDPSASIVVVRDGALVPPEERGVAVPLDAGPHEIEARAPDKKSFHATITLGDPPYARTVHVPVLEPLAPPTTTTIAPTTTTASITPKPDLASTTTAPESAHRSVIGPVLVVAGGALLVTGGVLAVVARSKYHDADASCVGGCDATGADETRSAQHWGNAATVFVLVGAATAVTGAVLWLTSSPSDASHAPAPVAFGVGPRGFVLEGSF